mmetsp:Transcript_34433/g.106939  ORF Transcript_34433/g.106939 Transcript_34433/m.106939 type:complete len:329 (+) Transcript_34433:150-1136(+)|eukprot:CAMPEP_0204604278 /NCGR_PEP_ID=MMETSP0661-20131031/57763_1 /ASSEMBLY_ACC=CAM_ASM_000606 /TAXON_ID=109239 /ORGANISM="Alexandrium margalefi, Strain AMGDE01CS-322" /LENGTH=328 /DNA_ID=CAMNT_0051615419 /DNA_START=62 /DNA_END=1048 /DNA_ORIENTATION=-
MGGLVSLCNFSDKEDGLGQEISASGPSDLFVDAPGKAYYEFQRSGLRIRKDGILVLKVRQVDYDGNIIKVTKGTHGFQDDQLLRVDGPLTGKMDDWFNVAKTHGRELSCEEFKMEYKGRSTIHIKGFLSGMASVYDETVVEKLKKFEVLAWDGEDYSDDSFTRLVPMYLNNNSAGVAVAFKRVHEVAYFHYRWHSWMAKHPGRLLMIPVDEHRDARVAGVLKEVATHCRSATEDERRDFLLARVALRTTRAKDVVALGGEGRKGWEAEASFPDGVHWTVYAVSRKQKEQEPSLCDFARKSLTKRNSGAHIDLVMGRDPDEAEAFHRNI